jgi:hypothetical protein
MSKKFQRHAEDFTCAQCGTEVTGDGYTNHCPSCLWSKHVDINPGDRAATCGGMMEPIAIDRKNGEWVIQHRCRKCGFLRPCKTREAESASVLKLAAALAHRQTH